jgi:tellurite resistance protein TehA-like permease
LKYNGHQIISTTFHPPFIGKILMNTKANHSASPLIAELADLSPAYFGLVMATGIVSLTAHLLHYDTLAQALFGINLLAYAVLWLLTLLRAIHHPRRFFGDMIDHLRGPGYFTTVAGTNILGSQFILLYGDFGSASSLWGLAIVLWVGLTYTIFTVLTVKEHKPSLDRGINGGWLLAVVATQSMAVLAALIAAEIAQPLRLELNFFALSMWLWGGMLYIWMMSLIFYRYTVSSRSHPPICRRRTGSTWVRWRSRRWPVRC